MPAIIWRRHYDKFVLIADNPDYYKNTHTNDVITAKVDVKYKNVAFTFSSPASAAQKLSKPRCS